MSTPFLLDTGTLRVWLIIFSGNYQDHDQGLQAIPAAQAVNKCILKREQIAIMKGGLARWKHGVWWLEVQHSGRRPAGDLTVDDGPVEPVPFEVFHAQNCDRGVEKTQPGKNQPELSQLGMLAGAQELAWEGSTWIRVLAILIQWKVANSACRALAWVERLDGIGDLSLNCTVHYRCFTFLLT